MVRWELLRSVQACRSEAGALGESGIKSVANPAQMAGCAIGAIDGDDIEAAGMSGPAWFLLQKILSATDESHALACIDALQCASPGEMPPIAHLDEYYCIAVEHDQIELAASTAPVLRQKAHSLCCEMAVGKDLGIASAALPVHVSSCCPAGAVSGHRGTRPKAAGAGCADRESGSGCRKDRRCGFQASP